MVMAILIIREKTYPVNQNDLLHNVITSTGDRVHILTYKGDRYAVKETVVVNAVLTETETVVCKSVCERNKDLVVDTRYLISL